MHEPHLSIAIGDFNSRVGDLDDTAGGLVQLPERRVVDHGTNAHGHHFITYLSDAGECIVNGRITPHLNAYTNVSIANLGGSSVVDFITSNYDGLQYFKEMRVTPLLHFLDNNNLTSTVRTTGKLGGHAILSAKVNVSDFIASKHRDNETVKNDTVDESLSVRKENRTRYRRKDIPSNFYRDEYFQNNIETIANEMDSFREGENNIDIVYNNIQRVYCRQMNEYLDPIKHRKTNQKHKGKPWWNEHLTRLEKCKEGREEIL